MVSSFLKFVFKIVGIFIFSFIFFIVVFDKLRIIKYKNVDIPVPITFLRGLYYKTKDNNNNLINKPQHGQDPIKRAQNPTAINTTLKKNSPKKVQESEIFLPILLYHYVEKLRNDNDTIRRSITVTPNVFEEQMRTLVQNGYVSVTLYDLVKALDGNLTLPEKRFILTFDDGYEDFYINVFPILKRYNLKATNFLILNSINLDQNLKSWQIKKLSQSGLVDFGAHSVSHSNLTAMTLEKMRREVADSKYNQESSLNIPLDFFAYPGGRYNSQILEVVKKIPFKAAVSTEFGLLHSPQTLFRLKRVKPGRVSGKALIELIEN